MILLTSNLWQNCFGKNTWASISEKKQKKFSITFEDKIKNLIVINWNFIMIKK